jgi:D-3-phosphoglycerate dehydrogenase
MTDFTIVSDLGFIEEKLKSLAEGSNMVFCRRDAEGLEAAYKAKAQGAAISWFPFGAETLDAMPDLLVVGRLGVGYDNIDADAATERGVVVVNTPDAPTINTAEHTVCLLLSLAKRLKQYARLMATGASHRTAPRPIELKGKTLGLVGLGRIGGRVAHICGQGLGMQVIGYDPYISEDRASSLGVNLQPTMADVLRAADFVSVHVPLSQKTKHLIGMEEFRLMKPTAFFINCSRGPVIDEDALAEALRAGELAGAGLDVWDPEPPAPSNPLLAMENVVGTPHTAGLTPENLDRMSRAMMKGVLDVLRGIRPAGFVNPKVWDSAARKQRLQRA